MPHDSADSDFGAMLRHAREQRGVSLRAISDSTKISLSALEALEQNDILRLPGGIFTRAFVRGYAREVGLDVEDTVRRFIESFPSQDPSAPATALRSPLPGEVRIEQETGVARAIGRALTVVAAVGLLVAYLVWSGRLAAWRTGAMTTSSAPPSPAAPIDNVAPMEETVVVEPVEQPGAMLRVDRSTSLLPAAVEEEPTAATAGQPASLPEGSLRLSLSASGRCWVSLRSDGVHSFAGTMEAGDARDVDVHGRVSLTVGDAGVFSYSINGAPARPMGGAGEVVTVVFTAQTYKNLLQRP